MREPDAPAGGALVGAAGRSSRRQSQAGPACKCSCLRGRGRRAALQTKPQSPGPAGPDGRTGPRASAGQLGEPQFCASPHPLPSPGCSRAGGQLGACSTEDRPSPQSHREKAPKIWAQDGGSAKGRIRNHSSPTGRRIFTLRYLVQVQPLGAWAWGAWFGGSGRAWNEHLKKHHR